jgi:monoamine oxidase
VARRNSAPAPDLAFVNTDVIVVGAGLSGLVCARRLVEGGARVVVFEARDRVGGRLHTGNVGGQVVDLGGHLMTATQERLAALAEELGVESSIPDRTGKQRFPTGGFLAAFSQWFGVRRIEKLLAHHTSAELDQQTLSDYMEGTLNRVARERLSMHAELILASDPADVSLASYLDRMAVTGGFAPQGPELPGGGRERFFPGGAQELCVRLARDLDVRLSSSIGTIDQLDDRVRVDSNFEARRLVLAIPPVLVSKIRIDLPPAARGYVERAHVGGVVKIFVAYAHLFWRDAGWSGEAYRPTGSDVERSDELRAVRAVIANGNALVAFVVGREAARWASRDPDERRREVIDTLVAEFGEAARDVTDYVEADWAADAWSAGCVASTPVGVLSSGAAWGESFGRVHVAGTEAARVWTGYMDGAIEAGERAAAAALAELG